MRLVPGTTGVCDASWIAIDYGNFAGYYLVPGAPPLDVLVNYAIRHETGHSVGLNHNFSTVSAMRTGWVDDLGGYNFVWGLYEPSPSHIGQINAAYP